MKKITGLLSRKNRIKDGAGLLNPLSYYLVKVGI